MGFRGKWAKTNDLNFAKFIEEPRKPLFGLGTLLLSRRAESRLFLPPREKRPIQHIVEEREARDREYSLFLLKEAKLPNLSLTTPATSGTSIGLLMESGSPITPMDLSRHGPKGKSGRRMCRSF